jgi:hypothetical protein
MGVVAETVVEIVASPPLPIAVTELASVGSSVSLSTSVSAPSKLLVAHGSIAGGQLGPSIEHIVA